MKTLLKALPIFFILMIKPVVADEPSVFFIEPLDGAVVEETFEIIFGVNGMSLAPAGTYEPSTGHHHLIIDSPLPNLAMPVPSSSRYLHFGKAQDRTNITLSPGIHTLQLLLGDGNHFPHNQPLISKKITIEVKP
jgi:hypothetical protein|tara:strand:- start:307 stop:711 length:405 start_codon:yes stop_codon:yes gene_type:complete